MIYINCPPWRENSESNVNIWGFSGVVFWREAKAEGGNKYNGNKTEINQSSDDDDGRHERDMHGLNEENA